MKRILSVILTFVILLSAQYVGYSDDNSIQVSVDGIVLEMDPEAQVINGSTYVPLTLFSKNSAFDAEIKLGSSASTNDYIISRKAINRTVEVHESKGVINEIIVNGRKKQVNIKVVYEQGQLWVPIVFMVEQLGGQATWSQATRRVMVDSYKPVVFNDKKLESAVRAVSGIAQGNIFKADLDQVTNFSVVNNGITDLEGIQYLTNLVRLDLSNNNISNISPLRQLVKLNTLYLNGNKVGDYSPLAEFYDQLVMKDFELKISIYDQKLEAIIRAELKKMSGELTLKDLGSIKELNLSNKGILDLQGIQYLTGLRKLDLSKNNISVLDPLKNLINLEVLYLNNNKIENIKALSYLKNLSELDLTGNKISDVSPLGELVKLKQLGLTDNNIKDISKISELVNLDVLILKGNQIIDISPLQKLVNIRELWLGQNKITNISVLEKLVNLDFLILKDNNISNVSSLRKLYKLKELYLAGNPITDYSPLKDLYKRLEKTDFPDPSLSPDPEVSSTANPTGNSTQSPTASAKVSPTASSTASPTPSQKASATPSAKVSSTAALTPSKDISPTATPTPAPVAEEKVLRFYIDKPFFYKDDERVEIDVAPIIRSGRTFLPARYVAESLGGTVIWNNVEKKVTVILGNRTVEMLVNSDMSSVDGVPKLIDVPPFIEEGRTLVPFRFIAESLGCEVSWDSTLRCVTLYNSEYVINHPEKFIK